MLPYEVGGRLPIELLADIRADIDACLSTKTDALGITEEVIQRPAWQILGQAPPPMGPAASFTAGVLGFRGGVGLDNAVLRRSVFGKEQGLVGIETLACATI